MGNPYTDIKYTCPRCKRDLTIFDINISGVRSKFTEIIYCAFCWTLVADHTQENIDNYYDKISKGE